MKRVKILKLRPTQMAIGMQEVLHIVRRFEKQGARKTRREIKDHPVVAVIGPKGHFYIINGHHRTMALWIAGHNHTRVRVERDYRDRSMSFNGFWKEMHRNNWSHLYDQFGHGPHNPIYLPLDIRGIADDPYRSLSWMIGRAGGYKQNDKKFTWANFFRKRHLLDREFDFDWEQAVKDGKRLARTSDAAKYLEGHLKPKKKEKKP